MRWFSACPASLATDPVKRIVVVMKDGAAREAPLIAAVFDQLTHIAAGRKATVIAATLHLTAPIATGMFGRRGNDRASRIGTLG
jgi:hypothetical protein